MLSVEVGSAWKGDDTTRLVSSKLPENAEVVYERRSDTRVRTVSMEAMTLSMR